MRRGPISSVIAGIQLNEGLRGDGVVDERTIRTATRLGYMLRHHSTNMCSALGCQNEQDGPDWLVVFGGGRLGVIVGACREHPLEQDSGGHISRLDEDRWDGIQTARDAMEGIRALHDVMAS